MNKIRLASAGGMLGIAGLLALPASSAHAAQAAPQGEAHSAALSLTVNPQALLNVSPALASTLRSLAPLNEILSGGDLGLTVDGANATGVLTADAKDLAQGHADSTPVTIDLSALRTLISGLNKAVVDLTAGQVNPQGTLMGVLDSVDPSLARTVSQVTGDLPGALMNLLHSLGVNVNSTLNADFNMGTRNPSVAGPVNFIQTPASIPLSLAPFQAHAVNNALAAGHYAGAEAEADNTTTNLGVLPRLPVLNGVDIPGLISRLTNLKATLSTVVSTVQQTGGATLAKVDNLVAGTPLAGITNTAVGVVEQTTNSAGQTVVDSAPLAALQSKLDSLISSLTTLNSLNALKLNDLIQTAGLTSTASLAPDLGGVTAMATTKLAYVDVLPIRAGIAGVVAPGTSLIHLEAMDASSTSSLGTSKTNGATGDLGKLSVLGHSISLDSLPLGSTQTISLPTNALGITDLTVNITRGTPVTTAAQDGSSTKSAMSVLEVQVIAGGNSPSALAPLSSLFGARTSAASGSAATQLVDLRIGTATTAVSLHPESAPKSLNPQAPRNPSTGMFGPVTAAGAAGLAGVAVLMQLVPRIASRRRRAG